MADYLVWRDDYSVGYPAIDDQHKRIVGLINIAFELSRAGGSPGKLGPILDDLQYYTATHFSFEEQILTLVKYPDIAGHRLLHAKMARKTTDFCAGKQHPHGVLPADVLEFLKDWWSNHIRGTDAGYSPFLTNLAAAEEVHRRGEKSQRQ